MFAKTFKPVLFIVYIALAFSQVVMAEEFSNTLDSIKVKSTGNKSVVVDVYVNSSDAKVKPELSTRKYEKDKYVIDLLNVTQKGNVSKDTTSSEGLVKNKNVKVGKVEGGTARVILNLDNPDVEIKEVRYHVVPGKPKSASDTKQKKEPDKVVAKPEISPKIIEKQPNVSLKPPLDKNKPKIKTKQIIEKPKSVVLSKPKIVEKVKTKSDVNNNNSVSNKKQPRQNNKPIEKPQENKNIGPTLVHKTDNNVVAENNVENIGPQIVHKTHSSVQPTKEPIKKEVKAITPIAIKKEIKTKKEVNEIKTTNTIPKTNISLDLPESNKKTPQVKKQPTVNIVQKNSKPVNTVQKNINKSETITVKPDVVNPQKIELNKQNIAENKTINVENNNKTKKTEMAQAMSKQTVVKKAVNTEQTPLNIGKNTSASEVKTVDVNTGGTDLSSLLVTFIGALAIVIPLIFIVIWLINLFYKGGTSSSGLKGLTSFGGDKFKIISSTSLGQGKSIHLVEIKGRQLVIGCTNNSINILTEFDDFDSFVEDNKMDTSAAKALNANPKYKKGRPPIGSFADLYKDYKKRVDPEDLEDEY